MSARNAALCALTACRKTGAWSDGALKEAIVREGLDNRDAALASRLCYGVVQNRMLMDFYIAAFLKGPIRKLHPVVLDILRLGVYQIVLMDRVPASAAVNEAVEQGKRHANRQAAGLINGVLRAVARADALPQPKDLATRYSHPPALVELLRENVGEALLEPLLRSHNEAPATVVQRNGLRITREALLAHWEARGIGYTPHPWLPDCWQLAGVGSIEALESFRNGWIQVQDAAARLAAMAAGVMPGMRVLDCCAAPGGKSFAAAEAMENQGRIIACDIHAHKTTLIEKNAARLGVEILTARAQDASQTVPEWREQMDVVIADVPCSGLGVIRKKPDIRYKDLAALENLPAVQQRILETVSDYVKPGGVLLYSTCTILKRENEALTAAFLQEHPLFSLEPFPVPAALAGKNDGALTLLPCLHQCDGFFIARLRKHP